MGRVLAAMAAGYCTALQRRTLIEQERIRLAALTALDEAVQVRRDSERRLRAIIASAGTAIAVGDLSGNLVDANPALGQMLGVDPDQLLGRRVFDFFHPDDLPDIQQAVYGELAGGGPGPVRMEKRFLRSDGSIGWTTLTVSLVRNDGGEPSYLVAVGEDVTERHRLQAELEHQARHDVLTGLPNRTVLYRRLEDASRMDGASGRLGVCYLDLDDFKAINDTLGHAIGDRLLVAIAERLGGCAAYAGHFIARVGGDEFVLLAVGVSGPDALIALAERMLRELQRPVRIDGHDLVVSASIGIVERSAAGVDPTEILRVADATLYTAKANGRARWALYDPERTAEQMHRYHLASRLPGALERGEFSIVYQPIVRLADATVVGVEALLRWREPDLGDIPADVFVPIAEQSGAIVAIGTWVLQQACEQAKRWSSHAGAPFISVNVSMRQCIEPGLVDLVGATLASTGLSAQQLQLEITETAVMPPNSEAISVLRRLADLDVQIALDDFGTGYSNLAHLRELPIRAVKLAGAFLAPVAMDGHDPTGNHIVEAVVRLCHAVRLTVTAEAVETSGQARTLRALGCDLAQGWHFGAATSAEDISAVLASSPPPR
jgi:diguanylate cyclase (GGDEF)-like protein/PAS domain S-box-containing protein